MTDEQLAATSDNLLFHISRRPTGVYLVVDVPAFKLEFEEELWGLVGQGEIKTELRDFVEYVRGAETRLTNRVAEAVKVQRDKATALLLALSPMNEADELPEETA